MLLPEDDVACLKALGYEYDVVEDAGWIAVVIKDYQLPAGFSPGTVDLMLRLSMGWPDAKPDMWWMSAPVVTSVGAPQATNVQETHLGRVWWRWSRHLEDTDWRAGVDGLKTFMTIIAAALTREVPRAA